MIYKRVLLSKMISFQSLIRFKKITLVQISKILIQPNNKENIFNLHLMSYRINSIINEKMILFFAIIS